MGAGEGQRSTAVKECATPTSPPPTPPPHPGVTKVQENYANEDKRRSQRVALTSLRGAAGKGVLGFVPLTGGFEGRLRNSPSGSLCRREPRKVPAESRGGEQSPESRGWVRKVNRSPPGSPLWAMLPEPRWKSLELLIINSCMRERTHTDVHRRTRTEPSPNLPSAQDGRRSALSHTHVLHRQVGCSQLPVETVGGSPEGARAQLAFASRSSAALGKALVSSFSGPGFGGGCASPFPATET